MMIPNNCSTRSFKAPAMLTFGRLWIRRAIVWRSKSKAAASNPEGNSGQDFPATLRLGRMRTRRSLSTDVLHGLLCHLFLNTTSRSVFSESAHEQTSPTIPQQTIKNPAKWFRGTTGLGEGPD